MATVRATLLLVLIAVSVISMSYQIENFEQTDEEVPVFEDCLDRGVFSVPCVDIKAYYIKNNVNGGSMCSNPYVKAYCCLTCQ
ncbi:hypothetical protein KP79_PYT19670 [Mizuhopecten yessoensis]|uniref:Uncharacterized protein n=1 Tax=Mizuhopecten yessoensis TaxID=6573 RepID=A0A210PU20_MIZYE|nr:hypothetical protein KP79_PYT19670 [Mizuhopecten yessoensis]